MRKLIGALLLLSGVAQGQDGARQTPLVQEGTWQTALLTMPNGRPVCATGTGTLQHGLWLKAQVGSNNTLLGFLEIRNESWGEPPPGTFAMRFDNGDRVVSPYLVIGTAVLVTFRDQWPQFLQTLDHMSSAKSATITLTERHEDALHLPLNLPPRVSDGFRRCIQERLLVVL